MYAKRSLRSPGWRFLITLYSTLLVSGLFFTSTSLAQITPVEPGVIDHCIETAADSTLNCTANDVNLGLLIVDDPNAECTETAPGSGIFEADVKFQADLVAGANERWDIGMYIALDGGDARTGICGRNYLPPNPDPLANPGDPGSLGLGGGVGPHYDGEEDEDPGDTCGDLPQGINWFYDLLKIDGGTGTPITPEEVETYTIRCVDTNDDGFVDVGTCTSWDNNRNATCTDLYGAYPNTKSKCNCERTETTLVMPAFLTLVKNVINDNGGTAVASEWTLNAGAESVTGSEAGVQIVVQPGDFALSESSVSGYENTSITCDDNPGVEVTSVTLESSDDITCTFVNDDIAPTLTLVKTVINDNGGTLTQTDFPSFVDGNPQAWDAVVENTAGAHTASETPQAGYAASSWSGDCAADGTITLALDQDAICYITNDDIAPTLKLVKTVVNDDGGTLDQTDFPSFVDGSPQAWDAVVENTAGAHTASETPQAGYAASSWSGDCAADGSITLSLDQDAVCYITNDDIAPTLKLVKTVINDNGGTLTQTDFPSFVDGSPQAWDAIVENTAGAHTASETPQAGYTAGDWGGDCAADGSITLALAQNAVCTITNDDNAPALYLVKNVVNDNGGTAEASDWTLSAGANDVTGSESGALATDQAGTYALSESSVSGYTNTSVTCDNGDGPDDVTIGIGETVTCTFVNDDDAPSLRLIKQVSNNNGGTAVSSDWTLFAGANSVTGSESPQEVTDQVGTYALSESTVANYTQTSLTCDNGPGQVTEVTIGLGETITCTFVNDDDAPSLILAKTVINDNGGTAASSDWTLYADALSVTGSVSGAEVTDQAGDYDLSEIGPDNYTNTSVTCDNGDGPASVSIGLGETVTCTFVNDDDAPSLILAKTVINDNGGTAVSSDWTLYADALSVLGSISGAEVTDQAGDYDLSEIGPDNYTNTSVTCDNGDGPASVSIGLGETVICTFVNDDDAPSLILAKTVINDNGGTAVPSNWTLFADALSVAGSVSGAEVTDQAGSYDLSESGVSGYANTSVSCDNGDGPASVSIGLGETVICTFVNDDIAPSLTLIKVVDNGLGQGFTAVPTDWTLFANGVTPISGSTPVASGPGFGAGTYDLSESANSDYTASDWVCTGTGNQTDGDTIVMGLADVATCTITNTAKGRVDVIKTLSGAIPPAGATFDFEIRTGVSDSAVGTTEASCTTDATGYCDFGGVVFLPGDYWFCEANMMPGWSTSLTDYPGAIVPNNTDPGVDNSVICAPFTLDVGETESFSIDNTPPPGGDARTIGFWKNWTSCDGNGNQDAVLDDNLPVPLGSMDIIDCPVAVDLLDKRDIEDPAVVKDGKKKAGDAAYGLAAQLLAYELNQNANAGTCTDASTAAANGHALLTDIGFDGTGNYLKGNSPSVKQDKADANMYAGILDSYNNNELCIVP